VVSAEPFGSYLVHDAVALAGRTEKLLDLVRRWETFLVDGYDKFCECWTWGTPVHGWSASPTRDLVAYVLGITPDQPGFTQVRVAPRSRPLHEIAGAVPTPHGLVEVRITGTEAEINSPVPAVDGGHRPGRPGGTTRLRQRRVIHPLRVMLLHPGSRYQLVVTGRGPRPGR
jgi:alpha-L-rhamnosidase